MEIQLPRGRSSAKFSLWSICYISLLRLSVVGATGIVGNETDRLALLEFKAKVEADPLGALTSWNSSIPFCQWSGVTCDPRYQRVTALDLHSQKLLGTISTHIGNLSFLRVLNLQNNSFHSSIPSEVGRLSGLQFLYLNNNTLSGPIPPSLSLCSNLTDVVLSFNLLQGDLPTSLSSLSKLQQLDLDSNSLTGTIPSSFGNISSLKYLTILRNNLSGKIPDTLGRLRNLEVLSLGGNQLIGEIPSSIFNISSLNSFGVGSNQLEGILPWDLGNTLPNLEFFTVAYNYFTGPIPKSVSNASNLQYCSFAGNNFTGEVPSLEKLSKLVRIHIGVNHLGKDPKFLCTLTNSTQLERLRIGFNQFEGNLPACIANLSSTLTTLELNSNYLSGEMQTVDIHNLVNLQRLLIDNNSMSGTIPPSIGHLKMLMELHLGWNKLAGQIPDTLGNLTSLIELSLRSNTLRGSIPSSLSKCQSLLLLDLSGNYLSGVIPPEIMGLSSLSIYADFSHNNLTGDLPNEVGNLRNLGTLALHGNRLSGRIPSSLGSCVMLEILHMQDNLFEGPIPSTLSSLRGLQVLNVSNNRLSGEIPTFLEDLPLTELGLAFNDFEGSLPVKGVFGNPSATSVAGNSKLCGGLQEFRLPKCDTKKSEKSRSRRALKIILISTFSGFLAIALLLFLAYIIFFKRRKLREEPASNDSDSEDGLLKLSYQSLLKATNGFSASTLIGVGSFGSVYRGVLGGSKRSVAVKVLNLRCHGATKSFIVECEALRRIRHRNLVKVLTACSSSDYQGNDFKALIYELMVNGSLEEWLHPVVGKNWPTGRKATDQLGLLQRINIAIDVAFALEYLHNHCESAIVHCDLKPSNVLLDEEMVGHVGDFGLMKFLPKATHELLKDQTSSIGVRGSFGYIAPEYGAGGEASTCGDVYSYGILILEMFTGKRPTDEMFKDGLNLHCFAKAALPDQVLKIIDLNLLQEIQDLEDNCNKMAAGRNNIRFRTVQECLASIIKIGVSCSSELPRERMTITDVVITLKAVRQSCLLLVNQREEETGDHPIN